MGLVGIAHHCFTHLALVSFCDSPLTPACLVFQFHALSSPQSPFPSTPTSRRALHRTLSDESIYSSQREHFFPSRASLLDQALPNDVLFSSTYPSLPKSLPLRRPSYTLGMRSSHGKCACSWAVFWMAQGPVWQPATHFLMGWLGGITIYSILQSPPSVHSHRHWSPQHWLAQFAGPPPRPAELTERTVWESVSCQTS